MTATPLAARAALVTGAAGGIGRAIATRLAAAGAGVLIGDLDLAGVEKVAAELNSSALPGRAAAVHLDVTDAATWEAAVRLARRRFGYPTILVNNAGVLDTAGLADLTEEGWARVVDVSQRGTWLGMRCLMPVMRLCGGGAIVNLSSVFGLVGSGGAFAYHAAKGAVSTMTRAAAVELAPMNIRSERGAARAGGHRDRHTPCRPASSPSSWRAHRCAGRPPRTRWRRRCCSSPRTPPPSSPAPIWLSTAATRHSEERVKVINGMTVIDATTHAYNLADSNLVRDGAGPSRYGFVFRKCCSVCTTVSCHRTNRCRASCS